jgi:broad specificity phosphatase PhoE
VSDLQCPARILVARHGEAAYSRPDVLLDEGGWLTERGREQAAELGERLRGERVSAVYTSTLERARQTGAIVASALSLAGGAVDGIQEFSVGALAGQSGDEPSARETYLAWLAGDLERRWPGAEKGTEVVSRFVAAVDAIADRHRGETVVVVSHGGVMTLAIPNTATNVRAALAQDAVIPNCAVAELAVDADGWRLVGSWPGRRWEPLAEVPEGPEAPDSGDRVDAEPASDPPD